MKTLLNGLKCAVFATLTMGLALGARAGSGAVEYLEPVYVGGVVTSGIDHWETKTLDFDPHAGNYHFVTNSAGTQTWGESGKTNWYVATEANVEIPNGIVCKGFVNLILCKGAKLTVEGAKYYAGIQTDDNGAFVIYGTPQGEGELSATGGYNGAGIGGSDDMDTGVGSHITINGGKVTAQSTGYKAAGIGSGMNEHPGYDITINGGTVIAKAAQLGAGIGGSVQSVGHDITINGGRVLACGDKGVAIGGGCAMASPYDYSDENTYGYNITINGGSVCVSGQGDIIGSRTRSHPAYNNRIAAGANVLFCLDAGLEEPLELTGSMVLVGSAESLADLNYKLAGGLVGFGIETLTMTNATTHETQTVAVDDEALVPFSGKKAAVRVSAGFAKLFVGHPIEATPTTVKHAKIAGVYTNGVLSSASSPWTVWTYEPAFAVYEAESGYVFQDGSTLMTNMLDTTVSPAVSTRPLPSPLQGPPVAELRDAEGVWQGVFDSLGTAIDAAQDGETVALLTNLQESVTFKNACAVTLDLAGWTLMPSGSAPIIKVAAENAALTIRDTSAAKTGSITTGGKTYSGDGAGICVVEKASLSMYGVVMTNCVAGGSGGAIYGAKNARILLKDCTVKGNVAGGSGGGIYKHGGDNGNDYDPSDKLVLLSTEITGNTAKSSGGGVYFARTDRGSCFAAGTMVLMADGSEKAIEDIREGDVVATFDHEGGTNSSARVYYACKGEGKATPFTLEFEEDAARSVIAPYQMVGADHRAARTLSIVGCHDLLLKDTRKYVTITSANVGQYIGAKFYGADGTWHTLTNVTMGTEAVEFYSIYSAQHQNVYANGLLTVADDVDYLLNIYELDENLKADAAQLAADLAQYGEMSYEEAATYGVSREWYDAGSMKNLNVAIGKQLVSKAYAEQLFASTGRAASPLAAAPKMMAAAPKLMTSAPVMMATAAEPSLTNFTDNVMTVGGSTVVTNNTVNGNVNNVYLDKNDSESRISLTGDRAGMCVGVTLQWGSGQFTDTSAKPGDVAYFWDDIGTYAVWHHSNNYLYLDNGSQIVPPAVAHTSFEICVGGVSKGSATSVIKGKSATVVYTADPGYAFAGGLPTKEVSVDTSKTVATMTPPAAPIQLIEYVAPVYVDGVASNGIAYWTTNTASAYTVVGSSTSQVVWGTDGATSWYVVKDGDFLIDGGVICAGHVNLILCEGAKLVVTNETMTKAGIATDAYGSFTVYGQPVDAASSPRPGELYAYGNMFAAGIGGNAGGSGSNITINGGIVAATSARCGAGIGGGAMGAGSYITINGGTVTATGGQNGAGIGGGQNGAASNITINGGAVTATGNIGAGIGSGGYSSGASGIVVNAGLVKAIGIDGSAGIGGGCGSVGSNIALNGGKIFVCGAVNYYQGESAYPNGIGNGAKCQSAASGVVIASSVDVLFNLTGVWNLSEATWLEPMVPMPDDFEGFVIMTPETQTVDRVLVGGLSTSQPLNFSTFSLTNAITGATGTIAVNGASVVFAERLLELPLADGMLTLTAKEYSMINPPTEVANTTAKVYTNGAEAVVGDGLPVTNGTPAYVVYTAANGYCFADGSTAKTNALDTTKNPATADAPEAPFVPVASVTTNGVTTVYGTLAGAWADATNAQHASKSVNAHVKLLADATVEATLRTSDNGVLTLDLNDYVLAYAGMNNESIIHRWASTLHVVDTAQTRTPRYFTCDETGLWTLTNEVTERVVRGGLLTGGRAGAITHQYGASGGPHSISNVNFVGNWSESNGGAVSTPSSGIALEIAASSFLGNVAVTNGGAISAAGLCEMTDCRVEANVAGEWGGGLYLRTKGSLVGTEVVGNAAGTGGGVYLTYSSTGCFPVGVNIRLADGAEKKVEDIVKGDVVATFDHVGGTNSSAAVFSIYRGTEPLQTFALSFASGATLDIADCHDLLLETTRKYVTVSSDNARAFVGQRFYNYTTGGWDELVGVTPAKGGGTHYSIYVAGHANCVANGFLTVPDDKDCFVNVYELDANLKADAGQLAADIAAYGLATPADYPNVPPDEFAAHNMRYARIAIGKGLTTQERILYWNEFDYGPVAQNAPVSVPKLTMSAAPMMLTSGSAATLSEPYLKVGEGTVVTGNVTTAGDLSNVYLKSNFGKDPVIHILPDTENLDVGVTLSKGIGVFGFENDVNYAASFTPDDPQCTVVYNAARQLELAIPVAYTEPVYVTADEPASGIAYWTTNTIYTYTVVESSASAVTWGEAGATNWYVVKDAVVQIDGGVICQGHVNLILCEGGSLTVTNVANNKAGIATDSSGSFAVYGQPDGAGVLEVTSGNYGAGIGGDAKGAGSCITVNGGRVTATSVGFGAGIGGGNDGSGSIITINGGTVTATSAEQGAGIGGGGYGSGSGITINGGTVTAASVWGAGIGGGVAGTGSNVTIANAKVFVCGAWANVEDVPAFPDGIGNGLMCDGGASNIVIAPTAQIFFNLTGRMDPGDPSGVWVEPISPMPDDFEGFVILTPDPAVARTLVGGIADWTATTNFYLAKPEQLRAKPIVVNGEAVPFASKTIALTHGANKLAIGVGELPDEPIVKDDKGNDVEIVVPQEWREEKGVADEDAVDPKNPNDNGMPTWQSYALGLDPTNRYSGIYADTPQNTKTDVVTVVTKNLDEQKLTDGFSVKYRLDTMLRGTNEYTKGTTQESASFDVKIDKADPTGVYKLNAVIFSNGVEIAQSAEAVNIVGLIRQTQVVSNAIVSVPWDKLAPGEIGEIAVSNVVKTANLSDGDQLRVYLPGETSRYQLWELTNNVWESRNTLLLSAKGPAKLLSAPPAQRATIPRGSGIWLCRKSNFDKPYYLYGQANGLDFSEVAITNGANLVGATGLGDYDLNAHVKGAQPGDKIEVPGTGAAPKVMEFKNGAWGFWDSVPGKTVVFRGVTNTTYQSVWTTNNTAVAPGTGFWLYNKSGRISVK